MTFVFPHREGTPSLAPRDDAPAPGRAFDSRLGTRRPNGGGLDLVRLGRIAWSEVPLLAVIDLLLALAGAVVAVATLSVVMLAPVVAALLLGPVWIGATASCDRLLTGDALGIRDLCSEIRRHARTGAGLALAPATVATLLLGSIGIHTRTDGQRWLLLPIAVDAAVLSVLAFGCIAVFPLAVATELRGRERWFAAIALAGQNLTASFGVAAIVILLALSARQIGPFIALMMAGPLCLLVTAIARRAVHDAAR